MTTCESFLFNKNGSSIVNLALITIFMLEHIYYIYYIFMHIDVFIYINMYVNNYFIVEVSFLIDYSSDLVFISSKDV